MPGIFLSPGRLQTGGGGKICVGAQDRILVTPLCMDAREGLACRSDGPSGAEDTSRNDVHRGRHFYKMCMGAHEGESYVATCAH